MQTIYRLHNLPRKRPMLGCLGKARVIVSVQERRYEPQDVLDSGLCEVQAQHTFHQSKPIGFPFLDWEGFAYHPTCSPQRSMIARRASSKSVRL